MTIEELRNEIDNIDTELVSLLNRRYNDCIEIRKLKQTIEKSVLDPNREQRIIERLNTLSEHPEMVETLWPQIMAYSRKLQNNLNKKG